MLELSDQELGVFELVGRSVGASEVLQWDTGESHRQGAYDGVIVYPDGRKAALEVVESTTRPSKALSAALDRIDGKLQVPGLRSGWLAILPDNVRVTEASSRVITAAKWMEARAASELAELPMSESLPPEVEWLEDRSIALRSLDRAIPGLVTLVPGGVGGGVDSSLAGLPDDVAEILATTTMVDHLRKLERADLPERHLFILIDLVGLAFRSLMPLMQATQPPIHPLKPIGHGITHLWLHPRMSRNVHLWNVETQAWSLFDPFDTQIEA